MILKRRNKVINIYQIFIESKGDRFKDNQGRFEKSKEGWKQEFLLGFYEGIPRTKRDSGYFGVLPDKITIFQRPLEELAGDDESELKKLIYEVVWHEERGEPRGRAANHGGFPSPPAAAKNVRTNLSIRSHKIRYEL